MAISFNCECGKSLKAPDEMAGRKGKCPQCSAVMTIPGPGPDVEALAEAALGPPSAEDYGPGPTTYSAYEVDTPPSPNAWKPAPVASKPAESQPSASTFEVKDSGDSSLLEYSYLLLAFALIPLIVSLLFPGPKEDIPERLQKSIAAAPPEDQKRIEMMLSRGEVTREQLLAALPGGKLDGAHLAADSTTHWVYAGLSAVAFLILLGCLFSVERANPAHLLGVGAFTGTVGIILLLAVQFCSNFRIGRGFHGRGWIALILLILTFIGWSYDSANDPGSNFFLSALGFTFGVGLCEEATKAIPLFFHFKGDRRMGWRGACLWGLASGIGFGVSEGIMYSSRYYNGMSGSGIYLVRFVSCVALHAMWSASVGIAIARNSEDYDRVEDAGGFAVFMLKMVAVPMVLHGFYDTLLKKDMNVWALVVALASFGWFAWQIERARQAHPHAGPPKLRKRAPAW